MILVVKTGSETNLHPHWFVRGRGIQLRRHTFFAEASGTAVDKYECKGVLTLALVNCHGKVKQVQSALSSFQRLTDELDEALKGPLSVGEYWGAMEIEKVRKSMGQTDKNVSWWLRQQGVVALVSSLEVYLEDTLKLGLAYDEDRLKAFLSGLSTIPFWKDWKMKPVEVSELVGGEDTGERLIEKALERVIFHKFERVGGLYKLTFGFELFGLVDKDVRKRLYAYRDLRHEILHGARGGQSWSVLDAEGYLERAAEDVLTFSWAVFDNVVEVLELEKREYPSEE